MEYFWKLLSRSEAPQQQRLAAPAAPHLFTRLPLEVQIQIMEYLPLESVVALSLSCSFFKCNRWYSSRVEAMSEQDALALQKLLTIERPDRIFCSECKILHRIEIPRWLTESLRQRWLEVRWPRASGGHPACFHQDLEKKVDVRFPIFSSTAFSMAMKRYHQQSKDVLRLGDMSSKRETSQMGDHWVRQHHEECRIVKGRLFHRRQEVFVSLCEGLANTHFELDPPFHFMNVCHHWGSRFFPQDLLPGKKQCTACPTDAQIGFKYYTGIGRAMFVTTWRDLGTSPVGEKWKQLITVPERNLAAGGDGSIILRQSMRKPGNIEWSSESGGLDVNFASILTSRYKAEISRHQHSAETKSPYHRRFENLDAGL